MDILDQYRYINVDDTQWYEPVFENFRYHVKEKHCVDIEPNSLRFELHSQGSGASCEYFVEYGNMLKFMVVNNLTTEYKNINSLLSASLTCRHLDITSNRLGSRYSAINKSVRAELRGIDALSDLLLHLEDDEDMVRHAVFDNLFMGMLDEEKNFLYDVDTLMWDLMDDLHGELDAEYEWLTSDEAVWDTILANGLTDEEAA